MYEEKGKSRKRGDRIKQREDMEEQDPHTYLHSAIALDY